MPKTETTEFVPGSAEIDEALVARRGFKAILHHSNLDRLDNLERKSLSAFSFRHQFLHDDA
jgi:hypothetical protein